MHDKHSQYKQNIQKKKEELREQEQQHCTFHPNIHKFESKRIKVYDPTGEDQFRTKVMLNSLTVSNLRATENEIFSNMSSNYV